MLKAYCCVLFLCMIPWLLDAQKPQTTPNYFVNPILPGMNPDPSICRVGEDYYLVTSTFLWFPGIPIYHSKDLINWELLSYALTTKGQLNLDEGRGIYAATIRHYGGTFYIVTTNRRNGENFYVTATNPSGPWSNPVWVKQSGIDPSLFFDTDGKVYFTSTESYGIIQSEIDIKTGEMLTEPKNIWWGTGARNQEGPHLFKYKGYYFLLVSEGGTEYGHQVCITRSTSPWGPFEDCPHNPILTHRDRNTAWSPIQGTGHADMVEAHDGSWWMVFLAFRQTSLHHHLGRETFITPFSWSSKLWPVVPFDGTTQIENYCKTLPLHPFPAKPERDNFDTEKLDLPWNFICNPENFWSLSERKGHLRLYGVKGNIGTVRSPSFIGRRQQYINCIATTSLDFYPVREGEEAGLSVYHTSEGHYDLFIRQNKSKRELVLRYVLGKITHEEKSIPLSKGKVQLRVQADKATYTFSYAQEGKFETIGVVDTKFLSSETLGTFVGVFFGMYAAGNQSASKTPADFDWFEIIEK